MNRSRKIYLFAGTAFLLVALILMVNRSKDAPAQEASHSETVHGKSAGPRPQADDSDEKARMAPAEALREEESAAAVEMKKTVNIPPTIGKQGLWAGAAPSDAAVGGRTAYAFARAGRAREDLKPDQNGLFQRLHAPKNQRIEFQVRYPGLKPDASVDVGILDGGTLEDPQTLKPDSRGRVSFVFHTGPTDGSYRILLTTSDGDIKMLDVWAGRPEWEDPVLAN